MIAFIFAWLLAMLTGHPAPAVPAPAPAAHVVVRAGETRTPGDHPGAVAVGQVVGTSPSPAAAAPTVAPQLPDEVTGRQIDCPDGQVSTEDADGVVHCP